jgi:hypothetical protein
MGDPGGLAFSLSTLASTDATSAGCTRITNAVVLLLPDVSESIGVARPIWAPNLSPQLQHLQRRPLP